MDQSAFSTSSSVTLLRSVRSTQPPLTVSLGHTRRCHVFPRAGICSVVVWDTDTMDSSGETCRLIFVDFFVLTFTITASSLSMVSTTILGKQ